MKKIFVIMLLLSLCLTGCQKNIPTPDDSPVTLSMPTNGKIYYDPPAGMPTPMFDFYSKEDYDAGFESRVLVEYESWKKEDGAKYLHPDKLLTYEDVAIFGDFDACHISMTSYSVSYVLSSDFPVTFGESHEYPKDKIVSNLQWSDMDSDLRTCSMENGEILILSNTEFIMHYLVIGNAWYEYLYGNLVRISILCEDRRIEFSVVSKKDHLWRLCDYPQEGGNLIIQNLLNKGTAPMQIAVLREYYSQ